MKEKFYLILLIIHLQFLPVSMTGQNNQKAELYVETGNSDEIRSISISPNGRFLISAGNDETVKLWDLITQKELRTFKSDEFTFSSVAFLADNKTFVAGDTGGNVTFWDITKTTETKKYKLHNRPINLIAPSPDNKFLASIEDNYPVIKLLNIESGEKSEIMSDDAGFVTSVAFSPDGKTLASTGKDCTVKLFDVESQVKKKTFFGHKDISWTTAISPDGKTLASGSWDGTIKIWDIEKEIEPKTIPIGEEVLSVKFSPNGDNLIFATDSGEIKLWDLKSLTELRKFGNSGNDSADTVIFSQDGTHIIAAVDKNIKFWNKKNGEETSKLSGLTNDIPTPFIVFSPNGKTLALPNGNLVGFWDTSSWTKINNISDNESSGFGKVVFLPDSKFIVDSNDKTIRLWNVKTGKKEKTFVGHSSMVSSIAFSPDGSKFVSADIGGFGLTKEVPTIKIWDIETGQELKTLIGHKGAIESVEFSPNGKFIVSSCGFDKTIRLWNALTGTEVKVLFVNENFLSSVKFSSDGKTLVSRGQISNPVDSIKFWEVETGKELKSLNWDDPQTRTLIETLLPDYYQDFDGKLTPDGKLKFDFGKNGSVNIFESKTDKLLASLVTFNNDDWIIYTAEGRFDTNKPLDRIEGLHWVVNDEFLKPLPLDIYLRQYYEPNLLPRLLKCTQEKESDGTDNCDKEFKSLPSIADINRVQPNVKIKEIKPVTYSNDLADVTIEVENVTDEISFSATDKTQKKQLSSGVYDLRLFRDGQLVGVSTPKDKLEKFIADAPRLVEENKKLKKLIDTPEDQAWREANDVFQIKAENVKLVSPTKIEYTFRNIKLPKDGRKEVEFTAYAFNSDKVKSTTTEPFKLKISETVANNPKKGRAYLISIGVNASENTSYNLQYAANDARKMQEIVGSRLKADVSKYSEVVQIPLISDYGQGNIVSVNTAQKAIIKGVFSLLAGNEKEVTAEILKQIPNYSQIKEIEPEDTLIITYAGHGYADQAGIFYLLPYDIGKATTSLNPQTLQKTISSDELSLWMQNITASEMIMIIDACYSSAAVQGDGFKPGPMGSRGLGQLAYDKDMKILSATQANNVALEIGTLQQGLLSYALLQDGIIESQADVDKDKQMLSAEWLTFGEKRVPELYQAIKDKKLKVLIDGKKVKGREPEMIGANTGNSNLNLQQPSLFDFKRRNKKNSLFYLP